VAIPWPTNSSAPVAKIERCPVKDTLRRGYTVVELAIAIGLISILAAIAYPSFVSYTAPFRVQAAGREAYSALQDARQQAVTRGRRVRFQVVGTDSYRLQWEDAGVWKTIRGPIQLEGGMTLTSSGGDLTFLPRGTVTPLSTVTVTDPQRPDHPVVMTIPITGLIRARQGGS
jgi:prepilin-type N-terminal cleavage/methylation domain-containing protein